MNTQTVYLTVPKINSEGNKVINCIQFIYGYFLYNIDGVDYINLIFNHIKYKNMKPPKNKINYVDNSDFVDIATHDILYLIHEYNNVNKTIIYEWVNSHLT